MSIYIIEPRDTVLFRDARPFTGTAGANGMEVPWPSTVTGLMRNRGALNERGQWAGNPKQVLDMAVAGPWLVELHTDGAIKEHYFPAPQDAVFFESSTGKGTAADTTQRVRRRVQPAADTGEFASDMPCINTDGGALLPLIVAQTDKESTLPKAASGPTWWKASQLVAWLGDPSSIKTVDTHDIGIRLPASEARMHVKMNAETNTGEDGMLFQTKMQRFVFKDEQGHLRRFAIAAWADSNYTNNTASAGKPQEGSVVLGGERRLSRLATVPDLTRDQLLHVDLAGAATLRIVLLTPGIFDAGYHPALSLFGGGKLIATATGRPQPISGWAVDETVKKGERKKRTYGPKPTRLMVPAGAVYWVQFENPSQAKAWADNHHFTAISDNEQDRKDGFGLIAVGRG